MSGRTSLFGAAVIMAIAGCAFDDTALGEASQEVVQTNGTLWSVEWAFSQTPASGVRVGVRPGGFALSPLNSSTRHFQGVGRLASGPYLVMSGSNASELFVAELASRSPSSSGRWGANRTSSSAPPTGDRVIASIDVADEAGFPEYDHAGGMQVIGDYVAVGLEPLGATRSTTNSAVAIVDVTSPSAPHVASVLNRAGQGTAGAVGITQMSNGRWLMAVGEYDSDKIDFYVSSLSSLPSATWTLIDTWARTADGTLCPGPGQRVDGSNYGAYQNLHLFTQQDGAIYLIGSHRDPWGDDFADLYAVSFSEYVLPCSYTLPPGGSRVRLTKVAKKHLTCTDTCNFDAGGGMYLDNAAQGLIFYGTELNYSSSRGYLRLNEF